MPDYEVNEGDFGGAFDDFIDNRPDDGGGSSVDDTPEPTESQDRLFDGSNSDDEILNEPDNDPAYVGADPTQNTDRDADPRLPDLADNETTTHNGFTIERAAENASTNEFVVKLGGQSIGKYGSLSSAESVAGRLDPDNYALGPGQTQEFQGFTLEGTGEGVRLLGAGELISTYNTVSTARSVARAKDIDNYTDSAMTGADPTQHGDTSDNLNDSGQYTDPATGDPVNDTPDTGGTDDPAQTVRYFIQSGQTEGTDSNQLLTAGAAVVGVLGALAGIASLVGGD